MPTKSQCYAMSRHYMTRTYDKQLTPRQQSIYFFKAMDWFKRAETAPFR